MTDKVYVESEFAPLRRVVLTETEVCFGKNFKKHLDMKLNIPAEQPSIEYMVAWGRERETLKHTFEKYGV